MWDDWEGLTEEEIEACFTSQPQEESTFKCDNAGCHRTFKKSQQLTKHLKSHVLPKVLTDDNAEDLFRRALKLCEPLALPKINLKPEPQTIVMIKSVANLFYSHRNLDKFYAQYPQMSMKASSMIGIPQPVAAQVLVKIFDAIVAEEEEKVVSSIAGISGRETDIIEYIGGHLLNKFSACTDGAICKLLTANMPKGSFIQAMEKTVNALHYPSGDFVGILHRVYYLYNKEVGTNHPADIDFARILVGMDTDPYYARFINMLCYRSAREDIEVKELLDRMLHSFINSIGPNFAKFTQQKLMPGSSRFTKGLRKDLASLCNGK